MSLLNELVVKLWMPLNDVKQTSLMVSGFQAKVLLQCPMLFKAMILTWRFRYHKSSINPPGEIYIFQTHLRGWGLIETGGLLERGAYLI